MTTAKATGVAERFLDAFAARDWDALAATFAEDARLRGLVPSALREAEGRDAIAERFGIWNGDVEGYEVLESEVAEMGDVLRIRWQVRGIDPHDGLSVFEQTAYAGIEDGSIAWMNLVCSGTRPLEA